MRAPTLNSLFAVLVLCAALAGAVSAQSPSVAPVRLEVRPAFEGMVAQGGVYPVVVTLTNLGSDTQGVLTVEPAAFSPLSRRYNYRVPLPAGSVKRVVAYPSVRMDVHELVVTYTGDFRGRRIVRNHPMEAETGRSIGLISDQVGALMALHDTQTGRPPTAPEDPKRNLTCSARPEDAPDRMAGYSSLRALVIADGAERMRPDQWDAIRRWTMAGGTLILSGGPGAVYLQVPEAGALSPVRRAGGATVPALRLGSFGPDLPRPVGLMTGALKPGASALLTDGGRVLIARMPVGVGHVVFTAFSAVERPIRGWAHQRTLLEKVLGAAGPTQDRSVWAMAMHAGGTPAPTTTVLPGQRSDGDPFEVKLPPTRTIVWLFLAYFVLVIPVSYGVLRRVRRLEWAWVTGPLLSVGFAFGFGLFAAELYEAGMSRRTSGVLVATSDGGDAQFMGSTELFFPQGGQYGLEVPGAEFLEARPTDPEWYGQGGMDRSGALETVDDGAVSAPRYGVTNLAFRRVYHSEAVKWGGLSGEVRRIGPDSITGRIRNDTRYPLKQVVLYLADTGQYVGIPDLEPGQAEDLAEPVVGSPLPVYGPAPGERDNYLRHNHTVAHTLLTPGTALTRKWPGALLIARTSGDPFGPPLGRAVAGTDRVEVMVSMPLTQGGT